MQIKIQNFEIQNIDYRKLKPIQGNLKDLSKKNYEKLKKSFQEKGLFVPMFVWLHEGEYKLLDGHGRERLFQKEQAEFVNSKGTVTSEVPCLIVEADSLEDAKQKILIISSQYQTITQEGFDEFASELDDEWLGSTVNFDGLYEHIDVGLREGETEPDSMPETESVEPMVKRGQLYQLGNHFLMCGDSTGREDVERLTNGIDRFDACITDPPYSVGYEKTNKELRALGLGKKDNSIYEKYEEEEAPSEILKFIDLLKADILIFSYPIDRHFFKLAEALKNNKLRFFKELVWVKNKFTFWPAAQYQQKHESILVCLKEEAELTPSVEYHDGHESILFCLREGVKTNKSVPINQSTVFEYDKPNSHKLHPTQKPIELWSKLVGYHVPKGGLLYEPFGGSGTSIIAAEMNRSRCYAMELSEAFCDTIIKRWEEFTGEKAVLIDEN